MVAPDNVAGTARDSLETPRQVGACATGSGFPHNHCSLNRTSNWGAGAEGVD